MVDKAGGCVSHAARSISLISQASTVFRAVGEERLRHRQLANHACGDGGRMSAMVASGAQPLPGSEIEFGLRSAAYLRKVV